MRRFYLIMIITVAALGCGAFEFRNGDLLFVMSGDTEFSDAITESTMGVHDSVSYVHVGIVSLLQSGEPVVVEASPSRGVCVTSLGDFLDSAPTVEGKPAVDVMRLDIDFPVDKAVDNALGYIGEAYDWLYLPDNGMKYCSELVYDSFLTSEGRHIFKAAPMNFKAADGSYSEFWVKLFEDLGESIPQGVNGTNPNDMARDSRLLLVHQFWR